MSEGAVTSKLEWPLDLVPVRAGAFSMRIELRAVIGTTIVVLLALAVAVYSLTLSTSAASVGEGYGVDDVIAAFLGTADEGATRVVLEWRLPRILFALLGGAALAISGAVFQSVTRNPLGSPDIIGFSSGAYTGALIAGLIVGGSAIGTSVGALAGGLLTGVLVYLLAYRGGVSGMRIIVVGIGVSLFLGAFNTWMLTTMNLQQAISAASWGAGDLTEIGWEHTVPLLIGLVIGLPAAMLLSSDMRMLEMGDDAGRGLGVRAEVVRVILLLLGVALVSIVTASAGPIAFVALAAPQLAMRAMRTPGVRIAPAAATGALLLVVSDLISRTVLPGYFLPVGVVTLCLGGAYLVYLLAAFGRKGRS